MRERTVGLSHPVRVLALLDRVSPAVGCVEQLAREPLRHRLFVALARGGDDPPNAQRLPARRAHFDRHLIGGAADAPRAHLDRRHDVVERLLEDRDRVLLGLALDDLERAVDDTLGHRLLAGAHDRIHELRDHQVPVFRVRVDLSLLGTMAAGHRISLSSSWPGSSRPPTCFPSCVPPVSLRSPGDLRKTTQSLGSFCSVFGAPLLAVLHALGVEHTAQDVVADARQVFYAAATDHHYRVLLQIVALARDVADHLEAVGEPHLGDLAQGRIRLFRRRRIDARAHAPLLRALLQSRHLLLRVLRDARLADQLVDGRHSSRLQSFVSPSTSGDANGFVPTRKTEERLALPVRLALTRFTEDRARAHARRSCTSHLTVVRKAASELHWSRLVTPIRSRKRL